MLRSIALSLYSKKLQQNDSYICNIYLISFVNIIKDNKKEHISYKQEAKRFMNIKNVGSVPLLSQK